MPLKGPWTDIGSGDCQRCNTTRRLYRPHVAPELALCAECSQARANSSLMLLDFEDGTGSYERVADPMEGL